MTSKRKSCPVKQRPFLELDIFDKNNKTTYDGTETVRELNKFDKKWFRENSIAVVATGKTFYGRTFVVPYVDIDGERYWVVDKVKKEKKVYWDTINAGQELKEELELTDENVYELLKKGGN